MNKMPAQWEEQECLVLSLPHENTDWSDYLQDIQKAYENFIKEVQNFQPCVVVNQDIKIPTNDTWIRDYGAIDIYHDNKLFANKFNFNAWGKKFKYNLDNEVATKLHKDFFHENLIYHDLVLEGGSIDTNGKNVLLTTSKCLLNKNRNPKLSKEKIEEKLKDIFGFQKIIWLENGHIVGDDTDSHIDTLARFISEDTIAYMKSYDTKDIHHESLNKMQKELEKTNFNLIALPMPQAIYHENKRLPATYTNFIFVNNGLIVPIYNVKEDEEVLEILQKALPTRKVVGVDASVFIRQGGSLHCASINRFKRK